MFGEKDWQLKTCCRMCHRQVQTWRAGDGRFSFVARNLSCLVEMAGEMGFCVKKPGQSGVLQDPKGE